MVCIVTTDVEVVVNTITSVNEYSVEDVTLMVVVRLDAKVTSFVAVV